eukprot:TRINITY_DN59405_c0_g1_i1.p1 TRINITY_DN59405_c0_g1~~TRINITY_DN59405_c0_g1_i1.p1  ORF type:complete len:233 (-),score=36.15 TRINITY_DN59405_c0_g1_i1:60-758(-)
MAAPVAMGPPAATGSETTRGGPAQIFEHPRATKVIVAAPRQRPNPMLSGIRSTLVDFVEGLVPDFLAGPDTAVLFISLKFHRLHSEYLPRRIEALRGGRYKSRVLLCRVDVEQPEEQLEQVTLLAYHSDLSLVLAWTDAEASQYLETFHRYQSKGAEALSGKLVEGDHRARLTEVLTTIKGVNRSDVSALATRFNSLAGIAAASEEELHRCPGIGEKKIRQLRQAFHAPFFG